jgi:Ethanolamine ammonia lyase large subunit (EutB)
MFAATIGGQRFVFPRLVDVLAKASPLRSGDHLAGVAAGSATERVAAQMALADIPLRQFLNEAVIPYEAAAHPRQPRRRGFSYNLASHRWRFPRLAIVRRGGGRGSRRGRVRADAGNGRSGQQALPPSERPRDYMTVGYLSDTSWL